MVKKINLSKEEKSIEEHLDSWKSASPVELEKAQKAVKNFRNKTERVNFRLSHLDLLRLKEKALREGIPYQTFLSGVIHKYVSGNLVDKGEVNKFIKMVNEK